MDLVAQFFPAALLGVFIGVFSGLLGIGGGILMVPVFRLIFGLSPLMSTGTSLFTILPTSLSGALSHLWNKTCPLSLGLAVGLGGACTSALGVWLSTISPPWLVMLAAALLIGFSSINMFRKAFAAEPSEKRLKRKKDSVSSFSKEEEQGLPSSKEDEPYSAPKAFFWATTKTVSGAQAESDLKVSFKLTKKQLLIAFLIGLVTGVASGYVGVGGAFIMVPAMISFIGVNMKQASGTSLIAMIIIVIPGIIGQGLLGHIDYLVGLVTALGSIPGAILGANIARLVPERTLRLAFGGFLVLSAIMLVLNEFHVLG